jgi:UDPglucose 6-dehydrogenase
VKVTVVGLGHVGLTSAACFAHLGHEVVGVDEDVEKLRVITRGDAPFFEPDLPDLLREGLGSGRFRPTEDLGEAARHGEVAFICVGTPIRESGEANLSQVERVARMLAPQLERYTVLTEKSTVPVGTGEWIRRAVGWIAPGAEFDVASNPEFLREGQAVHDTLGPSRIVVGASSERAHRRLREFYAPIVDASGCPYIATDVATAELIKLASNAFLATKISFINAVSDVCEAAGADVETVARGMGLDSRIGPEFLRAGLGYGGFCLPKDVAAFRHKAAELGIDLSLLTEVARVNSRRPAAVVAKLRTLLWNLEGKRIAVWGLSFKGGTDDLRGAPALDVIRLLHEAGAEVVGFDPVAMDAAAKVVPELALASDPYEAAEGADAVVLVTDWATFRDVDLVRLRSVIAQPVIVDGRNLLEPSDAVDAGFVYASMGRSTLYPEGHPDRQPVTRRGGGWS